VRTKVEAEAEDEAETGCYEAKAEAENFGLKARQY